MKHTGNRYIGKQNCEKRMHKSVLSFFLMVVMVVSSCSIGLFGFPEAVMADEDEPEEEEETFCGMEAHEHNEDCYEKVLVCGLEECDPAEGHTHTEECYEPGDELICELPEHEHTEECYSDKTADLEDSSIWEATLPTELSGIWDEDVVTIAASQLGYTESEKNFLVNENGVTIDERRKGYTRYGEWYGDSYGDWCAMFVSFCLYYAGVPKSTFPETSNCETWTKALERKGLFRDTETTDYVPASGDLIFFNNRSNDGKTVDHVGIVEGVDWEADESGEKKPVTIHTIEGNSSNCVKQNTYSIDNGNIVGYGVLPKPGMNATVTLAAEGSVSDVAGVIPALFTDGYESIGTISIPSFELELPVVRERSCLPLWITPVSYDGFLSVDNPVISGYNYTRYFGNLKSLIAGDTVFFTDVQGNTFEYAVEEVLFPQSGEEEGLFEGDWDLTLITCAINGDIRVAVHCTLQT